MSTQPVVVRVPSVGFAGTVAATVTLPPGALSLQAQATDLCGNVGRSAPVAATLDVGGCPSRLTSLPPDPVVFGPLSVEVVAGAARVDLAGLVDLLDPACAGAEAELVADGELVLGAAVVAPDGVVRFDDARLPEGEHVLTIRVLRPGESTDSPGRTVLVDLTAPTVVIQSPAGDPAVVFTDADPGTPGQQVVVSARIAEDPLGAARTLTATLDGQPAADAVALPFVNSTVATLTVTAPPGRSTLRVCAADAAGNEGCRSIALDADPAPPAAIVPAVTILDDRLTRVRLRFTMPGDDGFENGPVVSWEGRYAASPFMDEADWEAGLPLDGPLPPGVPGTEEDYETQALPLNARNHVALRAVDEVGRLSAVTSVEVDLRLATRAYTIPPHQGLFEDNDAINQLSIVQGLGDVDGDGFEDVLAVVAQGTGQGAAVVFGRADPQAAEPEDVRSIPVPTFGGVPVVFFGISASPVGDVNGDGAPDFAVVGVAGDFSSSIGFLYFGCPPAGADCGRASLASPSVAVRLGRLGHNLVGIGNFHHRPGDAVPYDDLLFGDAILGGVTNAYVIAGRADWPAVVNANELDVAEGRTELRVPAGLANGGRTGRLALGLGDLDGDGLSDLALVDGTAYDHTFVFYGIGALPQSYALTDDPRNVALSHPCRASGTSFGTALAGGQDLDGDPDGRPDLLVGDYVGRRVVAFDQDLEVLDCVARSEGLFGVTLALGDINGDGAVDLLAAHLDRTGRPGDVLLLQNDGLGRFGRGEGVAPRSVDATFTVPAGPKQGVTVVDFNGDGRADVVTAGVGAAGFRVVVHH